MVGQHELEKPSQVKDINKPISLPHYLISRFGVLMSTEQLASILGRSYISLYSFLQRSESEEAAKLNSAKKRIGRNIYFRTLDVAKILEE